MVPPHEMQALLQRLRGAQGRDAALDRTIAQALDEQRPSGGEVPAYTASVDCCLDLLHRLLPGWHWHVGYGASGILPYAVVADNVRRFEAAAPTVPLALLIVITEARLALDAAPPS